MSINRNFKLTTLTLFCLATVLPCLAAPALKQIPMFDSNIQIQSLLLPDEDGGDTLDTGIVSEGLGARQEAEQIALANLNADTLAESVSDSAFNVTTTSLSPSSQLAQRKLGALTQAGVSGVATSNPNDPGTLSDSLMSQSQQQTIEDQREHRWTEKYGALGLMSSDAGIAVGAGDSTASTVQLATSNGPTVVQLATGTPMNQANLATALVQAQTVLAQAKGAVPAPVALTPAGIALDEQISQSVPKGLVIAAQALGANGKLTPQAAKLFSAVNPQSGDSYIMMGDPKVTAEMARTLIKAGVKPNQMRAINLTQVQAAPTQFSGLNAQLSGIASASVAGNNKIMLAANGMAILQVAHRISPQDFVSQAPQTTAVNEKLAN